MSRNALEEPSKKFIEKIIFVLECSYCSTANGGSMCTC